MLYFPAMAGKKKRIHPNFFVDYFSGLFVIILLIFKWIGDFLIFWGKIPLYSFNLLSKLIIFIIKQIHNPFVYLSQKIDKKSQKKIIPLTRKVVFKRTLFTLPKITLPRVSLPRINWPFVPFIRQRRYITKFQILLFKIKYFLLGILLISLLFLYFQINMMVASLPTPDYLTKRDIATTTKIYDRNGRFLYEIFADENRTPVKLNEVPERIIQATIAIEDKEFYLHKGYSPKGIVRSIIHNLNSDDLEGGSTITQQLVRSALLTSEKTWERKIKEIVLSIRAEQIYSKPQIMEMYLNQVPYGGTAWGIDAAAKTYFGKELRDLTLSEIALLAGLPSSPTLYSPFGQHPELAIKRQQQVLDNMQSMGFITREEKEKALGEKLEFKKPYIPLNAPHFVMYVKDILEKYYGPRFVTREGLKIITTLDLNLQEEVQKILEVQMVNLTGLNVSNGAVLITNPTNGEMLSMIGSKDYFDPRWGNVNLTTALRQPGSSIKVVNYAAALENGFTAPTLLNDSPITFHYNGFSSYSPVNYDGRYHGWVTLRTALASSYNIPAVRVLNVIGLDKMIAKGLSMGITSWNDTSRFGLSLTLGGGEVTMVDMAKVYGTLANGGIRENLTPFLKITNYKGENIPLPQLNSKIQAIPPSIAFILSDILADNSARTPAFGPNSSLFIPGKTVAVKTGTSDNKRDNWTIGFTPSYVVAVWVGNNDNSPMNPRLTSGVTGAAPIWHDIMTKLLENKADQPFNKPDDLIAIFCRGKKEYFIKGTEPKVGCTPVPPLSPTFIPSPTGKQ